MKRLAHALLLLPLLLAACSTPPKDIDVHELSKFVPVLPQAKVKVLWGDELGADLDQYLANRPLVHNGHVYMADASGQVSSYDLDSGRVNWQVRVPARFSAGPSLGEGMLLLGTSDAKIIALDPRNGDVLWRTDVSSEVLAAPVAANGRVIVRTGDGRVIGLQAASGKQLWVFDRTVPLLSLRGSSTPLLVNDMVVVGFASGKLVALSQHDGKQIWDVAVAVPRGRSELERMVDIDADLVYADGVIYVASYQGRVTALAADSGRTIWTREMSVYRNLVKDGKQLYLTDTEGQLWALDASSGATLWKQDLLSALAATAPVVMGNKLLVGDRLGILYWVDSSDGSLLAQLPAKNVMQASHVDELADELDHVNDQFWPDTVGMAHAAQVVDGRIILSYRRGVIAVLQERH
ncbi:MAG: outer membrane protein assembly factor BamB [Gammaproteobacteria bacterium]|nr:outer membrane protein assembly factor BamB [Gammaproteobacteria bacterium]